MTARQRLRSFSRLAGGRPVSLVALATAVLLLAAGVTMVVTSDDDDILLGEARLHPDGEVQISVDGARFASVTSDASLAQGDRVRVLGGSAVLDLPGGSSAELREGSVVMVGGADEVAATLESGDLLVEVPTRDLRIDGGSAVLVVGAGAAKLRRSASLVAGVYEGSLLVAGAGQSLSVDRLRQAAVAGTGRLPDRSRPLALAEDDEWDRRFLGWVLDLDRRLIAFGRGFEALLDQSAVTPDLYRELLPTLADAPLTPPLLAERSAGENLIGLTIVGMADGIFSEVYDRVFGLRDQGARWGLVAADLSLGGPEVVDTVEAAIDRAPLDVASAAPDGSGESAAPGSGTSGGPTTTTARPAPPRSTTTAPGPGPGPGPGPDETTTTTSLVSVPTTSAPSTTTTTAPPPTTPTTSECGILGGVLGCE